MKWIFAAAMLVLPHVAHASDADANAVYDRLIECYATLNTPLIESVYAPGATYLPEQPELGIDTRDRIMRGVAGFHERIRKTGGSVSMKMRIVDRKRFGDLYVDNGYIRTTMVPAKGAAPQITTSKFATVLQRQPDGRWAILTDASSAAPDGAFDGATSIPGAKFDL